MLYSRDMNAANARYEEWPMNCSPVNNETRNRQLAPPLDCQSVDAFTVEGMILDKGKSSILTALFVQYNKRHLKRKK